MNENTLKELKLQLLMTYGKKGKTENRNRIKKEIARFKTKERMMELKGE